MQAYEIETLLLQEVGVNWSLIPRKQQWAKRCQRYFEPNSMQAKFSNNEHDITGDPKQWGGTGIISQGKLKHYSMGAGSDPSGLGRWTWALYRGKGKVRLRVVSIYQPCDNKNGIISVYAQHKSYLQEQNDDRDPRTAFKEDLQAAITEWLANGDQIIIGGDVNQSIFHAEIQALFEDMGMRNAIFSVHRREEAPPTFFRTETDRIVDGLWTTPGITIQRSGYLEPKDFPGDHSLLWADISYDDALGHDPPTPVSPAARRLQLGYSKVVDKYLAVYEKAITALNLPERQFNLEAQCTPGTPLTQEQQTEAEAIDRLRTRCMLKAEKKCRKLRMGMVQFSPELDLSLKRLAFWDIAIARRQMAERKATGNRMRKREISSRMWRRKKKAAKLTIKTRHLSLTEMEDLRKKEKQNYGELKKRHRTLRTTFLDTLDPKDRERLKRVEKQRELGRYAKAVTGKLE